MTITRLYMSITLLIAMALHGGIAIWFTLPTPVSHPEPLAPPLRINLLATVAETTVTNAPAVIPEPPSESISKPIAQPAPQPQPQLVLKPTPEPLPQQVKNVPEPEQRAEPVQAMPQPLLAKSSLAPLDTLATAQYEHLLIAWLEKHKEYPQNAKRLRIEGEGMLRILIDHTGRTQQVTLEQRTGNRLLDKAALEMVKRADPFPPMPDNDPRRKLEFIVPVAFVLH